MHRSKALQEPIAMEKPGNVNRSQIVTGSQKYRHPRVLQLSGVAGNQSADAPDFRQH